MYKIVAKVEGMMCNMCEAHINNKIRNEFKVKKVKASHKKGELVIVSEKEITTDDINNALKEIGYSCISSECGVR